MEEKTIRITSRPSTFALPVHRAGMFMTERSVLRSRLSPSAEDWRRRNAYPRAAVDAVGHFCMRQCRGSQGSKIWADFISKFAIACKEARETRYWQRVLMAINSVTDDAVSPLEQEVNKLIAILAVIIKKTQNNRSTR